MRHAVKTTITSLAVMVPALAMTTPALASGTPVSVNASVQSELTVSGITPTITFPLGSDGQTVTAVNAESYSVQTNDTNGVTVIIQPSNSFLADGSAQIGNAAMSVVEKNQAPTTYPFSDGATITVYNGQATSAVNFAEDWKLNIPSSAIPGNAYAEGFTYQVIGN